MNEDLGKLVVRLTLGILILLHGVAKLKGGVGFLMPMVQGIGLPPWVAYGVYIGQVVGPVMVILGLFARTGAFFIFASMMFSIVLVHRPELWTIGKEGGYALELQAMFIFTALALMLMSPGRFSVTQRY